MISAKQALELSKGKYHRVQYYLDKIEMAAVGGYTETELWFGPTDDYPKPDPELCRKIHLSVVKILISLGYDLYDGGTPKLVVKWRDPN